MKLQKLLSILHESIDLSSKDELASACKLIVRVQEMTSGEIDTLRVLYQIGPLFDGDIPSKVARDQLIEEGFAVKVIIKGEDGFNACTNKGAWACRILEVDDSYANA